MSLILLEFENYNYTGYSMSMHEPELQRYLSIVWLTREILPPPAFLTIPLIIDHNKMYPAWYTDPSVMFKSHISYTENKA